MGFIVVYGLPELSMRKPLANAVRTEFAAVLSKELPQFKKTKNGAGYHIYRWNVAPNLSFFVGLHTYSRDDSFTAEIAWNDCDEFPGMAFNMSPKEMPKAGGFRMPLSGFWTDDDPGWELAPGWSEEQWEELELEGKIPEETPIEEAMKKVNLLVADAVARLREYAIPYFAKIAKKFGHTLDLKGDGGTRKRIEPGAAKKAGRSERGGDRRTKRSS